MGPAETAFSPAFPAVDPIVVDNDMENPYQDSNLDFLDSAHLQMSSENAGRDFDDLFAHSTSSRTVTESGSVCLSPSDLSLKRPFPDQDTLRQPNLVKAGSPAESPEASSRSSSSESPRDHIRNASVASSASAIPSETHMMPFGYTSEDWLSQELSSVKEESLFGFDPSAINSNMDGAFPDLESSNKAMDAAFDFESAASSPSPLKIESTPQPPSQKSLRTQFRSTSSKRSASPFHSMGSPYLRHSAREPSPFATSGLSSQGKSPMNQWAGRSPSSLLEESFGGINMNASPPLNSSLNFVPNNFTNFGLNFAPSPQQHNMKAEATQRHVLTVHPTSLKSRVETQIPIRLTLYPLPTGVKKVRLPSHTISKPKFLAPASADRAPDTVELHTNLVCTSAMQDQEKLKKAFARARGEPRHRSSSSSPRSADDAQEEDKPLDGGEVKICSGCIQRERKRAFRKKQRKPEEDELFQKDEEKRVIVFNTNEIKDWTEPSKNAVPSYGEMPTPSVPAGAMQVELPMRIACYCRHQNEKLGFQVIFTVKDYKDNVIAQAITNSIMITDDHKTHAPPAPPAPGPSPSLPDGTQLPGVGVFPSGPVVDSGKSSTSSQHSSATDLQGLQQQFNSQYQLPSGPFAMSQNPTTSSTSRSLSRQTSPNDFQGPMSKRRKHSNSGRLPSELTMTKLENAQSSTSVSSTSALNNDSPFSAPRGFASSVERPFVTASAMSGQFANGPPTPNSGDNNPFFNPTSQQQQSLDSFIQQQLMSAPNSAQPSRPGTPGPSTRSNYQEQNISHPLGPNTSSTIWPHLTNAANRLPSVIHKLVPAEGSITGGTEVTLLGSGFYPGMEVVFGDTLATTTTFWGDKCLNCLTPPALQPGMVAVVFKHEHPTFGQLQPPQPLMPKQQQFFRYVDDRELQMYRLALGILGQKLGSQADAFQTAQQIMGSDPKSIFGLQKDFQGGSGGGHQRQVPGLESQGKLSDMDSKMLTYLEFVDLDDSPRPPKYNSRCATGQTLLHFAASLGLTRFVAGLLARGANPDVQDNTGNTPMHFAALNGHAHIVNRLRLAGANVNTRSIRGFIPADIASTLPAHQAALVPTQHHRSRSVGSLASSRRRQSSSASLHSLWESSSGTFDEAVDDSDNLEEDDSDDLEFTVSRRSSMHQDAPAPLANVEQPPPADDARPFSPPAALVAWRNQLQAQINQFQQSVANAFPNLPALPPMPALPDYQAHPMMRRITNLVPHRPSTARSAKEGWWDLLTGNSAPNATELPSYDELYPQQDEHNEEAVARMKKSSMLQAATDAALDQHFEAQASTQASTSRAISINPEQDDLKDIRIGRSVISREQQKHLREQQAQRMKGLGSDRNLYFIWIPLLVLVICAWARNYVPGIWQGISSGVEFVKTRYAQRALDLGV
ncbi:hypothetical protein ETB97_007218 [Aspergillus alliaceus]|uniref:IPT/TIG domain-containing protein n=1 Tax=Petromyces alliaceus TaxID=209559 RepID=A0A8H5ZWI6_PETAA|nr:hypothetical protein ETB97_007218 [Aspergillus burnettii]